MAKKSFLDIHGLVICCETEDVDLLSGLLRPFRYFQRENGVPAVTIAIRQTAPPYRNLPALEATFFTPRNVVYQDTNRKIIDYFGKGIVLQNGNGSVYEIYGEQKNFLDEAFYLLILSLLGQFCDAKGMLRIHAFAFSHRDKAVLVLLPQGGGKSTMAFAMMSVPETRYISDDDPILDPSGNILPFPRPLGILKPETLNGIPPQYIYSVDRMEFGRKYYIDCEYWNDKVEKRALKDVVLIAAQRVLNGEPSVTRISRSRIFSMLLRDAVIGIGLYQGMEFVFSQSSWEVLSKFPVFLKRFLRAVKLTFTSDPYLLILSNDIERNTQTLLNFLDNHNSTTSSTTQ